MKQSPVSELLRKQLLFEHLVSQGSTPNGLNKYEAAAEIILFLSLSLKRTTDVMFGGKQVVVCGYGEVRLTHGNKLIHSAFLTERPKCQSSLLSPEYKPGKITQRL